jgi:hypothetical protein
VGDIKRRRDTRVSRPSAMHLKPRDIANIEAVHRYRVLRQDQVQSLFFRSGAASTQRAAAQRVLVRLYDHGFLERKFLPVITGRSPTLYVLDRRGAELLRAERGFEDLTWYSSSKDLKTDFLEHTLAINDFRIAVVVASEMLGYPLLEWQTENELKADYERVRIPGAKGHNREVSLIPDSYFVLMTPLGRAHFFLEVDRGTEVLERFKTKVRAYLAYHESGAYEKRYGSKSLRILTIANGEGRLRNLKIATEQVGAKRRFWFARASQLTPQTVLRELVWQVAGEETLKPLIEITP